MKRKKVSERLVCDVKAKYNNVGCLLMYCDDDYLFETEYEVLREGIEQNFPFPSPGTFVFRGEFIRYSDGTGSQAGYILHTFSDTFDIDEYERAIQDKIVVKG